MKANPWVTTYVRGNDRERYQHLERRAVPQIIEGNSIQARTEMLKERMRAVFLCGEQTSVLIDQLLAVGEAHARVHFSSTQQVLGAIYSREPWGEVTLPAVMLTGLAGTGKTELIRAMRRLLEQRVSKVDLPAHRNLDINPAWFMSLREGSTLNALLGPHLKKPEVSDPKEGEEGAGNRKDFKQSHLLDLTRRVSRRDGVCLICVDEFQFITHSAQANTKAMGLLLQLLSLGPRLIFVANFSLARRLAMRRQEDRHRVLSNHLELLPDAQDSADYINYLRELTRTAPEDFGFNVDGIAELVHQYTFGIKRAVVELLGSAWAHCKTSRGLKATVGEMDVRAAYASASYSPYREDVINLGRHSIGDDDISPDLINPLRIEASGAKVIAAQAAINDFNRRVAEKHLEDMLPKKKCEALAELATSRSETQQKGKIKFFPRKGASSKDDLLDAFNRVSKDI